jgi:uncharacterized protein (DUF3820 family)
VGKCGAVMLRSADLIKLANIRMPFGKYKGCLLMDLPGPYLLWMEKSRFPGRRLGKLTTHDERNRHKRSKTSVDTLEK